MTLRVFNPLELIELIELIEVEWIRCLIELWALSFRCGALFNALSIRIPDFLIFAFRFLILIPA
jgi:hypothetical protein